MQSPVNARSGLVAPPIFTEIKSLDISDIQVPSLLNQLLMLHTTQVASSIKKKNPAMNFMPVCHIQYQRTTTQSRENKN